MTPNDTPAPARTWLGPTMVLAGAVALGYAPIGLRLSEFGPQATGFWRFLIALPLIAAVIYARGGRIGKPSALSLAAGVFFGLDIVFWHASLTLTSVANATFIVNLGNAAVGLIAWAALKERPAAIWPFALAIALFGALLLSRGGENESASAIGGDILSLIAAVAVAFYLFFAKLARRKEDAMSVLFWSTVTTLVILALSSFVRQESLIPAEPGWLIVPLSLAVVAHVLGQGLVIAGVGRTAASVAGVLLLMQPVAGAILAWRLFDESLSMVQLAGAGLVLVGVWLAGRR